jgi:hypothetical protein
MGSGAVIYVPSFIKTGSGIRKLVGGIHGHTHGNINTHSNVISHWLNQIYRYDKIGRK